MEEMNKKIQVLEMEIHKSQYNITFSHEVGKNFLDSATIATAEMYSLLATETPILFDNVDLSHLPHSSANEDAVQRKFIKFFESLPKDRIPWNIVDTSSSNWLKDPIGKVDFSIIDGSQVVWMHFISGLKVKQSLTNPRSYHEAIGQLVDQFKTVFELQPKRQFIISAVCCDTHIVLTG